MSTVEFTAEEKAIIVAKVKRYFEDELDQDIGSFQAEFLLDFFAQEVGAFFYNRGLLDAQAFLSGKVEEWSEAIYELEKPTEFTKL